MSGFMGDSGWCGTGQPMTGTAPRRPRNGVKLEAARAELRDAATAYAEAELMGKGCEHETWKRVESAATDFALQRSCAR